MKESDVQKKIIDYLEQRGHYVIKTVRTNRRGTPDLIVCTALDGEFYGIEVKAKGKKGTVTGLQKYHIELINNTGGCAFVAESVEDVKQKGL